MRRGCFVTSDSKEDASPSSGGRKARGRRAGSSAGKREKFRILAENRTNNALIAIGRIGNLSNRQLYEYDDAEVRKVIKALREAVSEVENRFASPKGKTGGGFKL